MTRIAFRWLPLLVLGGVTSAQVPQAKIAELTRKHSPETIRMREQIHRYPELGNREFKTAEMAAELLGSLGMEVTTGVAHTGVIAVLRGGKPGPVVAVRADMDALPVIENTTLPFKSEVVTTYLDKEVGVMHACGHDIHTAVQFGVAAVLAELKAEIPGDHQIHFPAGRRRSAPG